MNKLDILRDLARKYPKGPKGKNLRSAYFSDYQYCSVYEKYIDVWSLRSSGSKWGGHDERSIWEHFGEKPKFYEIQKEACKAYEEEKISDRAINLRAKRAYQKIRFAVDDIRSKGRPGVWVVRWSYKKSMFVWASGKEDAVARSFVFSGVVGTDSSYYSEPVVRFFSFGGPQEARDLNVASFEKDLIEYEYALSQAKERVQEITARKKDFEENASVILDMIESQLGDSIEND